jgi:hypothetical protein
MSELLLTLRCAWHILAAVAEHEAKVISEHTNAVLAAAKRRGVKIGGYRGTTISKAMRATGEAPQLARQYRQSKYVLEHISRRSIHPHLKPQTFGFVARNLEGGEHVQAESYVHEPTRICDDFGGWSSLRSCFAGFQRRRSG